MVPTLQALLLAVKELIMEYDAARARPYGPDQDFLGLYEIEVDELREIIEAIERKPWVEIAEGFRGTPYHLERENRRLDDDYALRKEWEAEEVARAKEYREERRRKREFVKAFLSNGERPRAEVYAATAEAFQDHSRMVMSFADGWAGVAKRQENGVWFWRLKEKAKPK
jgi:hypothetical protein